MESVELNAEQFVMLKWALGRLWKDRSQLRLLPYEIAELARAIEAVGRFECGRVVLSA